MIKKEHEKEKNIIYVINGINRLITESDIQLLEKIMRADHPYFNSCPKKFLDLKPKTLSLSILTTCLICNELYPDTLTNRVCPCSLLHRDYIHRVLKDFVNELNLLMSKKYKTHIEIDLLDVSFHGEEITLIKIFNQSKEAYDYLDDMIFTKHKNIKIDSSSFPTFCYESKTLLLRGHNKKLDNVIISVDRKYKNDIIEAIELFNEELNKVENEKQ